MVRVVESRAASHGEVSYEVGVVRLSYYFDGDGDVGEVVGFAIRASCSVVMCAQADVCRVCSVLLVGSLVIIARSPNATELAPLLITDRLSIDLLGILLFFRWRVVASVGVGARRMVCRVCCMSLAFF